MSAEPPPGPAAGGSRRPEGEGLPDARAGAPASAPRPASPPWAAGRGWGRRETAAERARRMIVQIAVGPSRVTVLTVIGSVVVVLAVLVIGYLTRP